MKPPAVRRFLPALLALLGLGLGVACGSKPSSDAPESPTPSAVSDSGSARRLTAPGFSLLDTGGKTVSLADYKGRVVFIDFWATWCPPCRISMPEVERLYGAYQGKSVQILGLSVDEDPNDVQAYVEKKKIPYPVLLAGNSDISSAYNVSGIPHFALIDQEGRLVNMWPGYSPGMIREWRSAIDHLLGS